MKNTENLMPGARTTPDGWRLLTYFALAVLTLGLTGSYLSVHAPIGATAFFLISWFSPIISALVFTLAQRRGLRALGWINPFRRDLKRRNEVCVVMLALIPKLRWCSPYW